ncbi:biopolymer transport protein ExbD/TolR [Psychromonas sp. CNPT3]|uniref:ExbD/TolR family protein n=1 Tax=Psychromonas sp. CNPT3 TaxID=314282 RepID=UPI00006E953A|nr:biopolymer transporter ExbD [Psychromonas sp. CNPT3]AGH80264.1 biopolymer transport protein ExbD/TolR [Psychromonas sp. CNPT3]
MKLTKSNALSRARFELLPLIDVIFLLLIFFIFVMLKMSMQSSIDVELPQLQHAKTVQNKHMIITIDAHDKLFVDNELVSQATLLTKIADAQQTKKRPILINGDKHASLGSALTLLETLRSAGYQQVAFATTKDRS